MTTELMNELEETTEALTMKLRETAEWRRSVAENHDEVANLAAANLLDEFACDENIEGSALDAYRAAWNADSATVSEAESQILRAVGFSYLPGTTQGLVETILGALGWPYHQPKFSMIDAIQAAEMRRFEAEQARMRAGRPANC